MSELEKAIAAVYVALAMKAVRALDKYEERDLRRACGVLRAYWPEVVASVEDAKE